MVTHINQLYSLNKELIDKIKRYGEIRKMKKSRIVRDALEEYFRSRDYEIKVADLVDNFVHINRLVYEKGTLVRVEYFKYSDLKKYEDTPIDFYGKFGVTGPELGKIKNVRKYVDGRKYHAGK